MIKQIDDLLTDIIAIQPLKTPVGVTYAMRVDYSNTKRPADSFSFRDYMQDWGSSWSGVGAYAGYTGANPSRAIPQIGIRIQQKTIGYNEFSQTNSIEYVVDEVLKQMMHISNSKTPHAQFDKNKDSGRFATDDAMHIMGSFIHCANDIAMNTRRGAGNVIIVSSEVANYMIPGLIDHANYQHCNDIDDTYIRHIGSLNGGCIKIFEYRGSVLGGNIISTYKGSGINDSGLILNLLEHSATSNSVEFAVTDIGGSDRYYNHMKMMK